MTTRRFEGDDIRNPIYVLNDSDIPRQFTYTDEKGNPETFTSQPSIKYYPYSDEFPDVPPIQVIGAKDLRKLYPRENIPDNSLALFIVKSIRTNLLQEYISEFYVGLLPPGGLLVGYYFVGEVQLVDYCTGNPAIDYYTLNSERPLEVNLAGKNLEKIQKVYFQYPNGVVKEAEILEGNVSERNTSGVGIFTGFAGSALIDSGDIWRTTAKFVDLDYINEIINANNIEKIQLDFFSEEFYTLPTKDLIEKLIEAGIEFKFERGNTTSLNSIISLTLAQGGAGAVGGAIVGGTAGIVTALIATMGVGTGILGGIGAAVGAAAGGIIGASVGAATGFGRQYAVYSDQYNYVKFIINEEDAVELELDGYEQIEL